MRRISRRRDRGLPSGSGLYRDFSACHRDAAILAAVPVKVIALRDLSRYSVVMRKRGGKDDGGQEIIDRTGGGLAIEIPPSDDQAADEIVRAIEKIMDNRDFYISDEVIGKARQLVEPRAIKDSWEKLLGKYEKFLH